MTKVLIICGPTASGKTSLVLDVAKQLGQTSIVSVDSRQVYEGLDIVSGKDLPTEKDDSVTFFGIDIFKPSEIANLSEYVKYARKTISEEISKHRNVILVGGTGLYLKGVTENLSDIFIPVNQKLRDELKSLSTIELQEKLKSLSLKKFDSLNNSDKNNPRRLIRHIEVATSKTSVPVNANENWESNAFINQNIEFIWAGLSPRKNQSELIRKRVIDRINDGSVQEIKKLLSNYPNQQLPIYSSLGVKEIIKYSQGEITLDEMVDLWSKAEENYAKRQMVWFKKQPNIIWYDETTDKDSLAKELSKKIN